MNTVIPLTAEAGQSGQMAQGVARSGKGLPFFSLLVLSSVLFFLPNNTEILLLTTKPAPASK